jgi:hypothetical protein
MNEAGSSRDGPPPAGPATGTGRRPILIAALGLALLVAGAAVYLYGDDLIELAGLLTSSRAIHMQGHIRY